MACADDGNRQGVGESQDAESTSVFVALPHRRRRGREAHLIGSPFLLLDALFVDGHGPVVVGERGIVISVANVAGVLLGLVLGGGVIGDGGEDGRWEYVLKRREHLDTIRSPRGELWRSRQGR